MENLLSDKTVALILDNDKEIAYKGVDILTKGVIIGVCDEGALTLKINGQQFNCFRGECIVVPPYQILTYVDCTRDIKFRILYMPEDVVSRMPNVSSEIRLQELPLEPVARLSNDTLMEIRHTHDRIARMCGRQTNDLNEHLKTLYGYTIILEALSEFPSAISITEVDRKQMLVRDFIRNLLLHFKEHRTVEFYAEKAFVTPKYLSHLVKLTTGSTIQEWISRAILQEAKRMLRNTDMTVVQVAMELDFSTSASFVRFFKAKTGTTPDKWRKQ